MAGMTARISSPRFVGRERELTSLAAAIEAAAGGRASMLLVTGTGGVGVSRLLDEAEARLARLGAPIVVIRGAGTRSGRGDPYAPLVAGLAPLLDATPDTELGALVGPAAEELARLVPGLAARLAVLGLLPNQPATLSAERRQAGVLEAFLGLLARLGEHRPVVLALEDLHLADAGTRSVATFLARIVRAQRLLVIGTYQPDELTRGHPFRADLAAMIGAPRPPGRLELGPLGRDELADLIEGIEAERPSASVLLLVAERSRGLPLLAEELLAARRELSSASLTGSLEELVTARLALRSPECRRVVRLLAPSGGSLTIGQLVEVAAAYERGAGAPPPRSTTAPRRRSGLLDADLAAGLDEAIESGILVLKPAGSAGGGALEAGAVVRFRHELIGRAVALDILPTNRPRHHAALGTALAALPAAAARHWLAAHENVRARQAAIEAASRAELLDSPGDALAHLELALELGADDPAAELRARAAEAAFGAGRPARASAYAEAAIARLDQRRDRLVVARLHERLGRYRRAVGDHDGAVAAIRRAVELVPPGESVDRARVLAALAQVRMLDGRFSEAEEDALEALRVCQELGDAASLEETHALTTLGVVRGWGDDPESGLAILRQARERARALGDRDGYFRATANLTTVLDLLGRREEAIEVSYEGIEEARRVGQEAVYGNFLRGNAAESLFLLGRWAESRALSQAALEWSEGGASHVWSLVNLAMVETETSAGALAGRLLGQALLDVETVREAQYSVPAYRVAASFALWRGDLVDARRAVERGWERVRETEDWSLIAKMAATALEVDAEIALAARERREIATIAAARARATEVLTLARAAVSTAGVPASLGSRREAEAMLATAVAHRARLEGRTDAATWAAVAATWAAVGNRYQVARARWREAEALLAAGEDARTARRLARRPLLEAVRIAAELGAGPLLRELTELAGRALITLPEPLPPSGSWVVVPGTAAGGATGMAISAGDATAVAATTGRGGNGSGPGSEPGDGSSDLVRRFVGEPAPRRADPFGLSPREKEVLALIAEGRTNREIGSRLFITEATTAVHVRRILAKLGVGGRVEAATVAIRLGLTERRPR